MTSYGYRLYTFRIKQERARQRIHPLVIEKQGEPTWRYQDHLVTASGDYLDRNVHGLPPRLDGGDRSQDLDEAPVFQLVEVQSTGQRVTGRFRHGRPSGHGLALPKASKSDTLSPIDISDYSPTRDYRFAMWFPESGETGIVAVEAISGACPTRYLTQWARWWSQFMAEATSGTWYNLVANPLGDSVQINEFIDNSRLVEMVLVAGGAGNGRLRRAEEFRITSTLDIQGKAKALNSLKTVVNAGQSDDDLAELLARELGRNVEDIDLDDGWLVLDTEYGQHQVSPSRIPDIFTYPIAETEPDDLDFHAAVSRKARELSPHVNGVFTF